MTTWSFADPVSARFPWRWYADKTEPAFDDMRAGWPADSLRWAIVFLSWQTGTGWTPQAERIRIPPTLSVRRRKSITDGSVKSPHGLRELMMK
jgi:hypothetical protein